MTPRALLGIGRSESNQIGWGGSFCFFLCRIKQSIMPLSQGLGKRRAFVDLDAPEDAI